MGSELTAAEVVSLVSPVAGRLGLIDIEACGEDEIPDEVLVRFHNRMIAMEPNDAARLVVGMIAEKCGRITVAFSLVTVSPKSAYPMILELYSGPRTLRTILAASCAAFARATEGGSDGT